MTVEVCPQCDIAGCVHIRDREAGQRLTFAPPSYPGGRILLMLGQVQIGAIFPPPRNDHSPLSPWRWSFWLCGYMSCRDGLTKSEQAAKNALLAEAHDWLRKAGLE